MVDAGEDARPAAYPVRPPQDPLHSLGAFLTFISRKDNSHSYTHLILALGIVREPTVWALLLQNIYCTHDIGLPSLTYIRIH